MSMRYIGGVISATPPTTSTSFALGIWTLEQQMQAQGAGTWPTFPSVWAGKFSNISNVTQVYLNNLKVDSSGNAIIANAFFDGSVYSMGALKVSSAGSLTGQFYYPLSGGSTNIYGRGLALDSSNNIFMPGYTPGTNLNEYVYKVDSSFTNVYSVKKATSSVYSVVNDGAATVDSSNNLYIVGGTNDGSGVFQKLNSSGANVATQQITSTTGAGTNSAGVTNIVVTSGGNTYMCGTFYGTDATGLAGETGWIGQWNWGTTSFTWINRYYAYYFCSCSFFDSFSLNGLAVSANGNVITAGVGYTDYGAKQGGVVISFTSSGTVNWSRKLTSTYAVTLNGVATDSSNNIYVSGQVFLTSSRSATFIAKYNSSGTIQWQRTISQSSFSVNAVTAVQLDATQDCLYMLMRCQAATPYYVMLHIPTDGSHTGNFTFSPETFSYSASSLTEAAYSLSEISPVYGISTLSPTQTTATLNAKVTPTATLATVVI